MYQLLKFGVIRLSDNKFFPCDAEDKDWQEYQKWLKAGNTPIPAEKETIISLRDLPKEIDELKAQIATINTKLAIK